MKDSDAPASSMCSCASPTSGGEGCCGNGSPESPSQTTYETSVVKLSRTAANGDNVTVDHAPTLDETCGRLALVSSAAAPMKHQPLKKLTGEQVGQAIWLYREGLSLGEIAAMMNVTRQAMHDLLKRRIKLRDRIGAGAVESGASSGDAEVLARSREAAADVHAGCAGHRGSRSTM